MKRKWHHEFVLRHPCATHCTHQKTCFLIVFIFACATMLFYIFDFSMFFLDFACASEVSCMFDFSARVARACACVIFTLARAYASNLEP